MPGPLTLSFLTYANDLPEQTRDARANGHELMLHVAMEPNDKSVDPGPNVLLVGQDANEIRKSLEWGLARFEGYVGVNNHMGSRFTRDPAGMTVVMEELARRGLLFLDSRTSGKTVAAALAARHRVPFEERNVFLDAEDRPGEAEARLKELEVLARRHGHAIAIGHPKEKTLAALAAWLPSLASKNLVLSPLSAVVRAPEETRAAKQ
ncbi:MAG: divergent polysaccharide deacetylase family protein [Rhodospirillales bacterium]|nr:divergent polysaccharide deacetylase family protein [Rhodospirillales bacterium]